MSATTMPVLRARDIMTTAIHYIDGLATVKEAAEKMRQNGVTTLIVEKRNSDDAWGMIVSQDMISGVIVTDKRADEVHVYEIMSKPIVTVPPDMDIRYVARLMSKLRIRRMPVEESGKLIGIVLQADLTLKSNLF